MSTPTVRAAGLVGVAALMAAHTACTLTEDIGEAPEDLQGLYASYWADFGDEAKMQQLAEVSYDVVARSEGVDDVGQLPDLDLGYAFGTQGPFTPALRDATDYYGPDGEPLEPPPAERLAPLYIAEVLDCTIAQYLPVLIFPDQDAIYESYTTYDRRFRTDKDAFLRGETDYAAWDGDIEGSILSLPSYRYQFFSESQVYELPDAVPGAERRFIVARTWMPYPSAWEDGYSFDQDHQLEVFLPYGDSQILHLYPVWRDMVVQGFGPLVENDFMQTTTLAQMHAWGKKTERACAEGVPGSE